MEQFQESIEYIIVGTILQRLEWSMQLPINMRKPYLHTGFQFERLSLEGT